MKNATFVALDPQFKLTLGSRAVKIPDIVPRLERIHSRTEEDEEEYSPSDLEILKDTSTVIDISDDEISKAKEEPYEPFALAFLAQVRTLPPPKQAGTATAHLQRELKSMMKLQQENSPAKLGFYFDPELSHDNLFHWIIEMVDFDPDLPIAKDMRSKGVKGILMEILFGPSYPFSPPFFRVIHPRFLPFTRGGGGHVTAGGSICMDLLTPNGWNSIYTIDAVLLQIKMAISNLEPRPARLDVTSWNQPYGVQEAIDGYKRACQTHGWTIPTDLDRIASCSF